MWRRLGVNRVAGVAGVIMWAEDAMQYLRLMVETRDSELPCPCHCNSLCNIFILDTRTLLFDLQLYYMSSLIQRLDVQYIFYFPHPNLVCVSF